MHSYDIVYDMKSLQVEVKDARALIHAPNKQEAINKLLKYAKGAHYGNDPFEVTKIKEINRIH